MEMYTINCNLHKLLFVNDIFACLYYSMISLAYLLPVIILFCQEAVMALNSLQSNAETIQKSLKYRNEARKHNVPNMVNYLHRVGLTVSMLLQYSNGMFNFCYLLLFVAVLINWMQRFR